LDLFPILASRFPLQNQFHSANDPAAAGGGADLGTSAQFSHSKPHPKPEARNSKLETAKPELRSRTPKRKYEVRTENSTSEPRIYQLKITLKGIRPPIWRRILVRADTPLDRLHEIFQTVMGWYDCHLHQFVARGKMYGVPDEEFGLPVNDERKFRLDQLVKRPKSKFLYEYDFGDDWQHEVLLEKVMPAEPGCDYPVCLKGKRSCPPEDVGGVWGYGNFLDAVSNKDHPEHEEYLDWAGEAIDPEAFDLEEVNETLRKQYRRQSQ